MERLARAEASRPLGWRWGSCLRLRPKPSLLDTAQLAWGRRPAQSRAGVTLGAPGSKGSDGPWGWGTWRGTPGRECQPQRGCCALRGGAGSLGWGPCFCPAPTSSPLPLSSPAAGCSQPSPHPLASAAPASAPSSPGIPQGLTLPSQISPGASGKVPRRHQMSSRGPTGPSVGCTPLLIPLYTRDVAGACSRSPQLSPGFPALAPRAWGPRARGRVLECCSQPPSCAQQGAPVPDPSGWWREGCSPPCPPTSGGGAAVL